LRAVWGRTPHREVVLVGDFASRYVGKWEKKFGIGKLYLHVHLEKGERRQRGRRKGKKVNRRVHVQGIFGEMGEFARLCRGVLGCSEKVALAERHPKEIEKK